MKDGPGATLTGRTIFPRVINFRVGVQTNVQARKVCKDYGNNGNNGNGARITKNNAGRGTPSTPQARPSDVKRRFTHRDFSRPRICAGATIVIADKGKTGGRYPKTGPEWQSTAVCTRKHTASTCEWIINAPGRFFHDLHKGANGRGGLDCGNIFPFTRKRVQGKNTHAEALRKTREAAFIIPLIT